MEEIINLINMNIKERQNEIDELSTGEYLDLIVLVDDESLFPEFELSKIFDENIDITSIQNTDDIINYANDFFLGLEYDFNLELMYENEEYIIRLIK